jgi:cytochrome c biogenesis protein CcmG, thiol:disulfide interchange protein DsbE
MPRRASRITRNPRRRVLAALLATSVLLGGCGGGGDEPRALPELAFPDVRDGRPQVVLASLRGQPAVVNVLAAWCEPCKQELPEFVAVEGDLGDQVAFVGVDRQDSRRKARELLDESGVTFPVGYDPDDTFFPRLRALGMPTTLLVDADGNIVAQHSGQLNGAELRRLIKEHFDIA